MAPLVMREDWASSFELSFADFDVINTLRRRDGDEDPAVDRAVIERGGLTTTIVAVPHPSGNQLGASSISATARSSSGQVR